MPQAHAITIELNEPEHLYVALEGVAGTVATNYMLKFDAPLSESTVRQAMREMVKAIPRFRCIVERDLFQSHLRLLPEGELIDQLFEQAWQCVPHVDADDPLSVEQYHNRLLNESVSLERGMACSFRWIPHERTPILFFAPHHLMFDGRSGLYVLQALMKRLNDGLPVQEVPLVSRPMLEATGPARWWQWPRAFRDELRIRGHEKALQKGLNLQTLSRTDRPYLSTYGVKHHALAVTSTQLRAAARQLQMSSAALVTLIMAEAFLSYAPEDPKALAVIRQAVDLRPYHPQKDTVGPLLGNQVGTFLVCESGHTSLQARAASVKAQFKAGLERYAQRQMGVGIWLVALARYAGAHMLAHFSTRIQRSGKMPRISCYTTSLGNVTGLFNAPGYTVKLADFVACVPALSMLHAYMELGDRVRLPLVWMRSEISDAQVADYLQRLDRAAAKVLDEAQQLAATA